MKLLNYFMILFLCLPLHGLNAQPGPDHSREITDTVQLQYYMSRADGFNKVKLTDSTEYYLKRAYELAVKSDNSRYQMAAMLGLMRLYRITSQYDKSVETGLNMLQKARMYKDTLNLVNAMGQITFIWADLSMGKQLLELNRERSKIIESGYFERHNMPVENWLLFSFASYGRAFTITGELDSAIYYRQRGIQLSKKLGANDFIGINSFGLADIYLERNIDSAYHYANLALPINRSVGRTDLVSQNEMQLARYFFQYQQMDSAFYYARDAFRLLENSRGRENILMNACKLLFELFDKTGQKDSAFYYLKINQKLRDEFLSEEKLKSIQVLESNEIIRTIETRQAEELARKEAEAKYRQYILTGIVVTALLFVLYLLYNIRQNRKANYLLKVQNEQIKVQKGQIEDTLSELKARQSQLIQSEKMASLGELTAGIAHEIQNPLNFVNNFSEVNTELLAEINEEIEKGNFSEVKFLAKDAIENQEKINHHGKRADAIVKGMLQHSGSNSGEKEPTDVNVLCDEYLRLAYHGLRAKDKTFNSEIKTDFDNSIEKLNVVPQDIGRVVLNLINNAFYAVNEKKKLTGDGYEPTVSVSTRKINDKVELRVSDNGNGIPQKVLDKIFQPFFTTKPTGQGTGLGLSLSYDIVKTHGGEIRVETKENEGTSFFILLPQTNGA